MFKPLLAGAALAAIAVGAAAGVAHAQQESATRTTICVDANGALRAAECRAQPSRLEPREDICLCPRGQRVEASICPSGVAPPAESLAVATARREILHSQASLVGASFEGRPLCVAPRQR